MTNHPANLRALKAVVLVVIALALGLQWAALQVVAWTGMTLTNMQTMPLPVAIEKATSGQEACALCLFIQENRENSAGEKKMTLRPVSSLDAVSAIKDNLLVVPHLSFCLLHDNLIIHGGDMESPPRPPPKNTV
ncbi:MAG: hypothetical protein QF685_09810 [Verrucomicrobiota bacterium]|jgi:hypothetical protein|nr:hypothetical protein [Verrucomicrobiota bacterium]